MKVSFGKRNFARLAIMLCFIMMFTACSSGSSSDVKKDSSAKREDAVLISPSPDTLDIQNTDSAGGLRILANIHETLIRYDETAMKFVPLAAESWEVSEDGKTYTFNLVQGNKFHNGEELKSSDVLFTYERAMVSPFTMNYLSTVDSIKALDDYTVEIQLKYAYGPFLSFVALPQLGLLSEVAVNELGESYSREPVGSGPYKFSEWKSGESVEVVAHEDYHKGAPAIKKVLVKFIEDRTTQVIALKNGEADILYEIPTMEKETMIKSEDYNYFEMVAGFIDFLMINNESESLKDPKVRLAIAKVIDYDGVLEAYTGGNGIVPNTHIPPGTFGFDDSIKAIEKNVEEAKKLMKEAGLEAGFTTRIMVSNEDANICAQVIQANLRQLNITAEIELYEAGTFIEKSYSGDYEMLISGAEYPGGDADAGLYPIFHSGQIDSRNAARYSNPRVDQLLDEARISTDRARREAIYSELSNILQQEMPIIPLDIPNIGTASNSNLKGVTATQLGYMYFDEWKWSDL